jgi:hypothetical protein
MSPRVPVLGLALLLFVVGSTPAADRQLSVDDVLRLHWASVSEDIIISEIIVTETVFELRVEELLRLKEAGLSDRLIQFMVDTGLQAEGDAPVESYEETLDYGGTPWINVIEEDPEPEVVYNVSLQYRYPTWWYDYYWYDYWYYDCGYAPYRSNWSVSIGAWYPGWYACGGISIWPGYGYRNSCWGYNPSYCHYYDPGYYYRDHPSGGGRPELSPVKYKSNGGSSAIAVASSSRDLGLKMRDGRTVTRKSADVNRSTGRRRAPTDLALADTKVGRRPTRHVTRTGAPSVDGRRSRPTRPSRAVRAPATTDPPRKVYTGGRRSSGVVEKSSPLTRRKSTGVSPSRKTPTKVRGSAPSRAPSSVRRSPARSAPRPAPAARSAPRTKSTRSGGGKGR